MSDNSRVRVSIVGVVIVALFSALVGRLWFLQMGPERKLKVEAIATSTRIVQTESPRGIIRDRNGVILAEDRPAWAVTLDRNLKKATRQRVIGKLSELLSVAPEQLQKAYDSPRQSVLKPAVIDPDIQDDQRLALLERQDDFPGVHVVKLSVREYPQATGGLKDPTLAAQVLGYVGQIDSTQLRTLKKDGYQPGSLIGRDGAESAYESVLRGTPMIERLQVDPTGRQIGAPTVVQPGAVGRDVTLTIDAKLQHDAEVALQSGIDTARTLQDIANTQGYSTLKATGGAAVVLNVDDGEVLAMASNPSFAPENWVSGISQANLNLLLNPASHFPLLNRVTQGGYQPGSTFKLVTSFADQRFGVRGPGDYYDDTGSVKIGNLTFSNDQNARNGSISLRQALTVSSDTYFYTAGNMFWQRWKAGDTTNGLGLQQQARDFGFGKKTGIELDETPGIVPDPKWKHDLSYKINTGAAKAENAQWLPGDEVHLAVGQQDIVVSPLQLADAYAAFVNGSTLVTPHVGMAVTDPVTHKIVQVIDPKARGTIALDPTTRQAMLDGFSGVVNSTHPVGTAQQAFQGFTATTVSGKTGTAQVANKGPTSWFVAYFNQNGHNYVALAAVEEGGHGSQVAAPIVRQMIESMFHLPPTPIARFTGHD